MRVIIIASTLLALVAAACESDKAGVPSATRPAPTIGATNGATPAAPGAARLSGTLTLDGKPFDSRFIGARVIRNGLAAACQDEIPTVVQGRYEITVAPDAEVRGCGAAGAHIVLWVYTDTFIYSQETAPWPGDGAAARFDATFVSISPAGATTPTTDFKGHLFDRDGMSLPGGTLIEAYAGDTRCAATSLRSGDANEGYYTLSIAGPAAVPGCGDGATISFRLNGLPAAETAVNDLGGTKPGAELDLHVK